MGTRIKIDGVGTVEVDDSFTQLSAQEQQHTVEEIAASAKQGGAATAPSPTPAPAPTPKPSGPAQATYAPIERAIKSQFPNVRFTSDYRDPQHNRSVGGVEGSLHTMGGGEAVDMVGGEADTPEGREAIRKFLASHGVSPKEFLYHNAGSGNHLHIGATELPEAFLTQWGNHPAPHPADAAQQPDDGFFREVQKRVLRGDTVEQINEFSRPYGRVVNQADYAAFKASHAKAVRVGDNGKPEPEQAGLRHDVDYYGDQIRRGVGDLFDAPANIADAVYHGGQAIAGRLTGQTDHLLSNEVKDLPLPDIARPGAMANAAMDDSERQQLGYVPDAANGPQRYAGAVVRMAAGALGPAAKAKALKAALAASVGGGVGGEVAHDVAPTLGVDPDKARLVGQVLGSAAGASPAVVKPINEARFIAKRVSDPRTPFAAKAVEKMGELADASAPGKVFPKGRGPLSVEQINAVGKEFLNEVEPRLAGMKLDPVERANLAAAIKRKADLKPNEIAALEGTPSGDAVAEAIRMFQATRALTPGYNGYKPGIIRRSAEIAINAGLIAKTGPLAAIVGPAIRHVIRGDPADLNMSRLDAGAKALKRRDAWAKLGQQTGADTVGSKTADFIKAHEDTVAATKADADAAAQAKADAAQARQDATAQRTQERADKQAQADADKKAKADAKAARHGMSDKEYANYSARSNSAQVALSENVPAPRKASVQKALTKYQSAIDDSSAKLGQFDPNAPKPETATKAPKRSPYDLAVEQNIAQDVHGNHNAYADSLGVTRSDVLAALRKIKTDDIPPFELQKLRYGYKLSTTGRAQLIPRLQKQLQESGVTEFRAKEAATAPSEKAPQISDKAKSAAPPSTNVEQIAAEPEASAPNSSGNYRDVRRKPQWEAQKARNQADFDAERARLTTHEDSVHSQEIVRESARGLDHIRDKEKTVESAMRYFDEDLGPRLRAKDFLPGEIDDLRKDVERIARAGKTYKTDAEFERGAKVGPRGRPRKQPASDDVPF